MRCSLLLLAALAGCSSTPLPPRLDVVLPLPAPSASASAAPSASAVSVAEPVTPTKDAGPDEEEDDATPGAKLALEDGFKLVLVVSSPSDPKDPPEVTLTLRRAGQDLAQINDFAAVTGVKPQLLTRGRGCDTWSALLTRETWGSTAGVRASIVCANGEDYFSATELAVLFGIFAPVRDLDGLTRLWAGLADTHRREMDSCSTWRRVTFRVIDARTLEKTITEEASWQEQGFSGELKRTLLKGCKIGTTTRVERVALP